MNFNEFCEEYTKLYRFFYKTNQPDADQLSDIYELLHHLQIQINDFRKVCRKIKENEEVFPRNVVAYINNYLADENERQATGEKNFFTFGVICSACCDGWIVTPEGAKYCLCSAGQRLKNLQKQKVQTASYSECSFAARENNSNFNI